MSKITIGKEPLISTFEITEDINRIAPESKIPRTLLEWSIALKDKVAFSHILSLGAKITESTMHEAIMSNVSYFVTELRKRDFPDLFPCSTQYAIDHDLNESLSALIEGSDTKVKESLLEYAIQKSKPKCMTVLLKGCQLSSSHLEMAVKGSLCHRYLSIRYREQLKVFLEPCFPDVLNRLVMEYVV